MSWPPGALPTEGGDAHAVAHLGCVRVRAIGHDDDDDTVGNIDLSLDGTEPTSSSSSYSGAITVSDTRSVKARAYRTGWTASDSATASYWISAGTVATPTVTPSSGTLTAAPLVAMACATSGATIRYTLDGTDPTERSSRFVYPILVTVSSTVKARAFKAGFAASAVASANYVLDAAGQTGPPTIVPDGGRITAQQTATITGLSGAPCATDHRRRPDGHRLAGAW